MANEKRLIDKKSAWKTAQRIYSDPVLLHAIKNTLDTTPTVDVVEVKHGRWRFRKNWDFFVCSECSYESSNYSHYCPNCGAKMDGDGNG